MRSRLTTIIVLAALMASAACSDDGPSGPTTTASTTTTETEHELDRYALTTTDLPGEFVAGDDVDDTITRFCATEDATAGLQASARAVRGFTRAQGGASVIQLVFRFRDDGAATFVQQAEDALTRCSGVPDLTGLAFDYDAVSDAVAAVVADAGDARTTRHGVSVGSGNLSVEILVLHDGDVGELVAVLGLDLPRHDLDALAEAAFAATVAKL